MDQKETDGIREYWYDYPANEKAEEEADRIQKIEEAVALAKGEGNLLLLLLTVQDFIGFFRQQIHDLEVIERSLLAELSSRAG